MSRLKKYLLNFTFKIFLNIFAKKYSSKKINFFKDCKIIILQFENLQQALSITPLIKVLNTNLNASITICTNIVCKPVFENNPHIKNSLILRNESGQIYKNVLALNKGKFDVVIDVHERTNKIATYMLGFINSPFKVGFANGVEKLLTHRIPIQNYNKVHIVDRILRLADAFEINIDKTGLNLIYKTSKSSQNAFEDYSIKHDLVHKATVVINISNNSGLGFWGIDNYLNIIKYLKNYELNIVVAASIEDVENADKIAGKNKLVFYNTDFDLYAELINNSNFIFSPDSFSVQLAAVFKKPVFCLFVQHKTAEMINVPYNSDFDFALTDRPLLSDISFGKVLNSFVPYFEYIYERYQNGNKASL